MEADDGGAGQKPAAAGGAELRQQRLSKLERLRQQGIEPFASRFDSSHTTHQSMGLYEEAERGSAGGAGGDPEARSAPPR